MTNPTKKIKTRNEFLDDTIPSFEHVFYEEGDIEIYFHFATIEEVPFVCMYRYDLVSKSKVLHEEKYFAKGLATMYELYLLAHKKGWI